MQLIFWVLAAIIPVWWLVNRWRSRAFFKLANTVPSNRWQTLLGFGIVPQPKDIINRSYEFGKKYGPNSVIWIGPYPIFLTTDPETLREVLTAKNCVDKPFEIYNYLASVIGQGLFTESDPIWSEHRKLFNKAFSNKNLVSFLPTFNAEIEKFVAEIATSVDKGEYFDMLVTLRVLSLKNATRITLKRNLELTKINSTSMAIYLEQILQFITDITVHQILTVNWIRNIIESYVYKSARDGVQVFKNLIHESLNIFRQNDISEPSFLAKDNSMLDIINISEQKELTENEKQGLLMQFFFGSFETTSATLFFALCLLAMHPEYQDHTYEEVNKILSGNENTELTLNKLNELTYLDMIFNETMRILPVVPMVFRKVSNQDFILSNGTILPVGQIIALDIFQLHRSEAFWGPHADVFNPDNFLPSNVAARHPYSFIPFTKGQRFCIGWRYGTLFFKIALAKLIKTFKFSTDFEYKNLKFENHITLKLVEQPRLKLERRQIKE